MSHHDAVPEAAVPGAGSDGTDPTGRRFVGYRRIAAPVDSLASLPRQAVSIEAHAARAGLVRARPDFVDVGASGTSTRGRPAFRALMDAVVRGELDAIVVDGLDVFSRNLADLMDHHDLLRAHGVALHAVAHGGVVERRHVLPLGRAAAEHRGRVHGWDGRGARPAERARIVRWVARQTLGDASAAAVASFPATRG